MEGRQPSKLLYVGSSPAVDTKDGVRTMDMTPQDMIQHTIEMAAHEERMKISRAQEMAQIAEAANRKSAATYRYSLVQYLREEVEMAAANGRFSLKIYSNKIPWSVGEIEQVLPFLKNDGFKVELSYDNSTIGLQGAMSNLNTTYKVLDISWK